MLFASLWHLNFVLWMFILMLYRNRLLIVVFFFLFWFFVFFLFSRINEKNRDSQEAAFSIVNIILFLLVFRTFFNTWSIASKIGMLKKIIPNIVLKLIKVRFGEWTSWKCMNLLHIKAIKKKTKKNHMKIILINCKFNNKKEKSIRIVFHRKNFVVIHQIKL